MSSDVLQAISDENMDNVLKELEVDMPRSALVRSWITTMMHWKSKIPTMKSEVLCLNGNWKGGSVICICKDLALDGKIFGVMFAREDGVNELKDAMNMSPGLPWDQIIVIPGITDQNFEVLESVFQSQGFEHSTCTTYFLSAQDAAALQVPPLPADVHVAPLDVDLHLDIVCDTWPYFEECMRPVLRAVLQYNLTMGVFVDGALAATVLQTYHGGVGALQTLPEHRGRGLATIALASLALDGKMFGVLFAREDGVNKLKDALNMSPGFPWYHITFIAGILGQNFEVLKSAIEGQGFDHCTITTYFLSAQDAAKVQVPPLPADVHVAPLDVDLHLDIVCDTWPYFEEYMRPVLRAVLQHNFTMGVFVDGVLAATVLQTYHGGVGALQTLPAHQGRGLATIALASLVRAMAQAGLYTQLRVNTDNHAAHAVVRKLGFKVVDLSVAVDR